MLLGIVSDTHGHVRSTAAAAELLRQHRVDLVLHCGDVGSREIVDRLKGLTAHFVRGNVDDWGLDRAVKEAGQTFHGSFGTLVLEHLRIAFLHGDDQRKLAESTHSGRWDLVCYGHTHRAEHHYQGGTLVLNPGALYRASPRAFALVELPGLEVRRISLPAPV